MRVHYLIHIPEETPGGISDWAKQNGHSESYTRLYLNEDLPDVTEPDFLVVMGGSMNIYQEEKYPWLKAEKQFIKRVIEQGKKVLGVCLGAQLVTSALGSKVVKNGEVEIGWFPVFKTKEGRDSALLNSISEGQKIMHWHGDTFSIPGGATHLLYSEACENQAFLYGNNVLALQFHLELTTELLRGLVELEELPDGRFVQSPEQIVESEELQDEARKSLFKLLDKFVTV
ncbi:Glutamine amidotransferase, class I [hydrothermal vent metagenome]|uniref:Glutamine amidotransferase, class I n=1 Tax=hydrothermal vent metagenome TaxID=652676 RepID=A0A3B0UCY1_9ZZZZ